MMERHETAEQLRDLASMVHTGADLLDSGDSGSDDDAFELLNCASRMLSRHTQNLSVL